MKIKSTTPSGNTTFYAHLDHKDAYGVLNSELKRFYSYRETGKEATKFEVVCETPEKAFVFSKAPKMLGTLRYLRNMLLAKKEAGFDFTEIEEGILREIQTTIAVAEDKI